MEQKTFYLSFLGFINEKSAAGIMAAFNTIVFERKITDIHFLISTPGGNVNEGFALYHYLRSLPASIKNYNIGSIDSIGNVIFLAADERYATPQSAFLFHGVTWDLSGRFNLPQLGEFQSSMQESEKLIESVVTERTKISSKEIKDMFLQGKSLHCDTALEKGIIGDIVQVQIPADAEAATLSFTN